MGSDLVKVLTGIRGSGKSVMLELVKDELCASGVDRGQFVSLNFEEFKNAPEFNTWIAKNDCLKVSQILI